MCTRLSLNKYVWDREKEGRGRERRREGQKVREGRIKGLIEKVRILVNLISPG